MGSFSIVHIVILCLLVVGIAWGCKAGFSALLPSPRPLCTTCGHEGESRSRTKGSAGVELVLWLFLLVPGLIYSIWRASTRHEVCGSCGAATLVPADSPVAVKLRKDLNLAPAVPAGAVGPSGERL